MTSKVTYKGDLRTECEHVQSQTIIVTDAPVDNQGKGEAFSPTDTVATGLASCMLTIMGIKARDLGVEIVNTYAEVTKEMEANPRRISKITVRVFVKGDISPKERIVLENAAKACPVIHSLHPEIQKVISFTY